MPFQTIDAKELQASGVKITVAAGKTVTLAVKKNDGHVIRFFDSLLRPIDKLPIRLTYGGMPNDLVLDQGKVVVDAAPQEKITFEIPDWESALSLLEPCWKEGCGMGLKSNSNMLVYAVQPNAAPMEIPNCEFPAVVLIPSILRTALIGMHFDTNKCFLLPGAMKGIRRLPEIYQENPGSKVLVVGHADSVGSDRDNLNLSMERAEALAAFLQDRAEAWYAWYGNDKPQGKRWGTKEDQCMLSVLPAEGNKYYSGPIDGKSGAGTVKAIRDFQTAQGLKVDGIIGEKTRKALIQQYMALDGTSLPADCEVTTHACGEFFPETAPPAKEGEQTKTSQEGRNRRVEVFFFHGAIIPAPPGKESKKESAEYSVWRNFAHETIDLTADRVVSELLQIWLLDAQGQRMGANPQADRYTEQEFGAPYRIKFPSGEVRAGFANKEGLLVEYNAPHCDSCELEWGKQESAFLHVSELQEPVIHDADAEFYYLYSETIYFSTNDDTIPISKQLANLGFAGEEQEQKQHFENYYGKCSDDRICEAHESGLPRTLA